MMCSPFTVSKDIPGQKKKPLSCEFRWDRSLKNNSSAVPPGLVYQKYTLSMRTIIRKKLITEFSLRRPYFGFGLLSEAHSPPDSVLQSHHLQLSVSE